MNIVFIEDQVTFLKCKSQTVTAIMSAIRDQQEVYLVRQFETCGTDATAMATIEVAKFMGFKELAERLTEELNHAKIKEAN